MKLMEHEVTWLKDNGFIYRNLPSFEDHSHVLLCCGKNATSNKFVSIDLEFCVKCSLVSFIIHLSSIHHQVMTSCDTRMIDQLNSVRHSQVWRMYSNSAQANQPTKSPWKAINWSHIAMPTMIFGEPFFEVGVRFFRIQLTNPFQLLQLKEPIKHQQPNHCFPQHN